MQGLSRDILATKMLALENKGYKVIMHVHDEVVLEVKESVSIEDINNILKRECISPLKIFCHFHFCS